MYNITLENMMQEAEAKINLLKKLGVEVDDEREAEIIIETTEQFCYSNQLWALNEARKGC